jgi:hypothetical protein
MGAFFRRFCLESASEFPVDGVYGIHFEVLYENVFQYFSCQFA